MDPGLSIVVPAFDEAARIGPTLDRLVAHVAAESGGAEIVVVDDGSRDATAATVEAAAARSPAGTIRLLPLAENRGKGAALRAGVATSRGREILLCDADLSTPVEELANLRLALAEAEVVLGSRAVDGARITLHQPWHREAMGRTFNRIVRLLVLDGFRDTQCGFKLLRGEVGRELFAAMTIDRYAFDVELVWLAVRRGYRVREVGVAWHDSPDSRVHPVRDAARMMIDLARIRWRHRGEVRRATATRAADDGVLR